MRNKSLLHICTVLVAFGMATGISGCGKHRSSTSREPVEAGAATQGAPSNADLSTPITSYQQLGVHEPHWMAMYYGTAHHTPVPFKKFASVMVNGYAYQRNPFTKQKEVEQITPEVTNMVAMSKKNRYYILPTDICVNNYDMSTKSFHIGGLVNGVYGQGNYGLRFSNGVKFNNYVESNTSIAETMENMVENPNYGLSPLMSSCPGGEMDANIYFYAQGTEYSMSGLPTYTTIGQITKLVIYNGTSSQILLQEGINN